MLSDISIFHLDFPDSNLPESIGVVENASTSLSLDSSGFILV
jgi:hypothetical protein